MSIILSSSRIINCDYLGCQAFYEAHKGCDYAADTRAEAAKAGWAINVPRKQGPCEINPLPPIHGRRTARLDFCPDHSRVGPQQ